MAKLYDAGQDRETLAIFLALVKVPSMAERIWQVMGHPHWHGVNINFAALLGSDELKGDADIIGVPAINGHPDFDAMFAIEVKTYKFDLKGELKGVGSKLDEADAQADKLRRLGFAKTGILHVLTTENKPERAQSGSNDWWDASDRAMGAYDKFRPLLVGRPRRHHVFIWPCGALPTKDEDQAGAGCPLHHGQPDTLAIEEPADGTRAKVIDSLKAAIQSLPQQPWPTVFGHCRSCAQITQVLGDGSVCKRCEPLPEAA